MSGVRVLVGTRKGAFVLTSDGARRSWDVSGPHFGGWEVYHMKGSPVDPNRIYASQSSGWFGQIIQRSDDGGKTWNATGNEFRYDGVPGTHQWYDGTQHPWEFKRVWHLEPSLSEPDTVFAGIEDAALFKSTDGGKSWRELSGLRQHGSGNLGATNAYRVMGWKAAAPIFVLDIFKGWLPVVLFAALDGKVSLLWALAYGAAAILGHVYSVFVGFRGGGGRGTVPSSSGATGTPGGICATENARLRDWLAAGGIHPGYYAPNRGDTSGQINAEVLLSVTPPPQMPATHTEMASGGGMIDEAKAAQQVEFNLTQKGIDFLGYRTLRHLLGAMGRSSFGSHETPHLATGVEAEAASRPYEFGDTLNLDVAATLRSALAREGLRDDGTLGLEYGDLQLALLQEFLPGATDGWDLALASQRNGTDFTDQSRALGVAVAEIHADLPRALVDGLENGPFGRDHLAPRPVAGAVHLAGAKLGGRYPHERTVAGLARTFQNIVTTHGTVADNLMLGRHALSRAGFAASVWNGSYRTVKSANDLINSVNGVTLDPGTRSGILAMAYVLKAAALGEVLQTFEQLPIDTYRTTQPTFVSRDVALDAVLALLDSAEATLEAFNMWPPDA